ncbi:MULTISPECIES: ComEC/Rec2 family competence protein [Gemella]|nr:MULTISPECIES: ComEC/Rec2 family competence protein [Gemella]
MKNKNLNARKTICCLIVFLVFFVRGVHIQKTNITHLNNSNSQEIMLNVDDMVAINGNYLKGIATIDNEKVLFNYTLKTKTEKDFFKENFTIGRIYAIGSIEDLKDRNNFYSFDYKNYNKNKGIFKQITLKNIEKIEDSENILSKLKEIRIKLIKKIDKDITFDKSGYFQALIFGDKSYMQKDDVISYKNLGTSHLLAISGLHLGVLVGLIYYVLGKMRVSVEIIEKIIFLVLPFYIFISGLSPSILRAGGTILIFILLRKNDKSKVESLCITCIILLALKPLYVFDIGFELSFFIAFSLLMSGDYIKSSKNPLQKAFKISLISSMASFPILAANFYTFSYISLISNIILVPIFSLIIFPIVLISYTVSLINLSLFKMLFKPILNIIFNVYDKIQELFGIFKPIVIGKQKIITLITLFLLVLFILANLNKRNNKLVIINLIILTFIIGSLNFFNYEYKFEKLIIAGKEVYYLREKNKTLLINTSNNIKNFYTDFRKKDSEYDIMDEYHLLLNHESKRNFDYLLITSSNTNISGYANEIAGHNLVKNIIILDNQDEKTKELVKLAKFKNIKIEKLEKYRGIKLGEVDIYYEADKIIINKNSNKFEIKLEDK